MSGPADGIIATIHGIAVPSAPHFGPRMIRSIAEGRFERNEIAAALATIRPGARILELGAGSGVVGAIIARNCRPARMLSVEANPALIEHIGAVHALNGLEGLIEVRHGIVASDPEAQAAVDFFVAGNFLGSGLAPGKPAKARPVTVPVLRYAALKAEFPHDTLVMDIEGAEREFLRHADLSGVETVILEVHRGLYGREGMREIRQSFARGGFAIDAEASRLGVHVYCRAASAGSGPVPDPVP